MSVCWIDGSTYRTTKKIKFKDYFSKQKNLYFEKKKSNPDSPK